ncbi:MAG: S24/S26 family peptidase [Ruminococcus sp.]|nr:S24/S26 family peptidase [Ruminococcus sp.]
MKNIDTKSYLDALCKIAKEGKTVSTIVTGSSMTPFLGSNRDFVYMKAPDKPLKKGDIVLVQRKNGDYVLHRIKRIKKEGIYLLGDRQYKAEGPVSYEQIRCIVTSIKRKDKLITPKALVWKFYQRIWINTVFLRPVVFKLLSLCRHKNKTQSPSPKI